MALYELSGLSSDSDRRCGRFDQLLIEQLQCSLSLLVVQPVAVRHNGTSHTAANEGLTVGRNTQTLQRPKNEFKRFFSVAAVKLNMLDACKEGRLALSRCTRQHFHFLTLNRPSEAVNCSPTARMELMGLARAAIGSPVQIRKLWRSGPEDRPPAWRPSIYHGADEETCLDDPFSILSRAALEFGESFLALDIAETGIRALKGLKEAQQPVVLRSISRLGHCKALALARTGSTSAANQLLQELYELDSERFMQLCPGRRRQNSRSVPD